MFVSSGPTAEEGGNQNLAFYDWNPFGNTTSRIYIPFGIIGMMGLIGSILYLILYCKGFEYEEVSQPSQASFTLRDLCKWDRTATFHIYFLASLFFMLCANRIRINCLNLFMYALAVSPPISLSNTLGGALMTTYCGCMTLSRLVMAGLSQKIPMTFLLWAQSVLLLVSHVLLLLMALDGPTQLWVLAGCTGLFAGAAYPSFVSWSDRYIEVQGYVMATIDIGIGVGSFTSSWLSGMLFDYKKEDLFYLCVAGSGTILLFLLPLQVAACVRGDRYKHASYERMRENSEEASGTTNEDLLT